MSIIKFKIFLFLFFTSAVFSQQDKETLYVFLGEEVYTSIRANKGKSITFSFKKDVIKNKRHRTSHFVYNAAIDTAYTIKYTDIKNKLISINEAVARVENYLEVRAKECEEEYGSSDACNVIRNPPVYNYNNYFDKIYIFEKITDNEGVLYEVTWRFFIAD